MRNSARQGRQRAAQNLKRKREGISSLSTGLFILECDRNLIENHEADFLAIDVAWSEGAIFDVSNSHFLFLSFILSVFIIPHFWRFVNRFFRNFSNYFFLRILQCALAVCQFALQWGLPHADNLPLFSAILQDVFLLLRAFL